MLLKKVYLISSQDKYCPENNNGDHIVEVWDDLSKAEQRRVELDREYPTDTHYLIEMDLNKKEYEGRTHKNIDKPKIWHMDRHSIFWFDFDKLKISGHCFGLKIEDEVHCQMQSGKVGKFKVIEIKYMNDPKDQFFGVVGPIGYVD